MNEKKNSFQKNKKMKLIKIKKIKKKTKIKN